MLNKIIFFIFLFSFSIVNAYILRFKNSVTNQIIDFDVGARFVMTGKEIKVLLSRELNTPITRLIVFRPDDYKSEKKDRNLDDFDEIDVIAQTNKDPVIYRTK